MIYHLRVRLVSPILLGGSDSRAFDPSMVLRPPSIRGQLRFWTRALARGSHPDLEAELWGSTEARIGQRVSLVGAAQLWHGRKAATKRRALFPPRPISLPMVDPSDVPRGTSPDVVLRFRVPPSLVASTPGFSRLQAVVWTWLHLGTLGRRQRRGYGSLVWVPTAGPGDLLEGFVAAALEPQRDLANPSSLEKYLRDGLAQVERALGRPSATASRSSSSWFQLQTIDQVFVGSALTKRYDQQVDGMEDALHGIGGPRSTVPNEPDQLGRVGNGGRLASPMLWRVFPVAGDPARGYIPVLTWSPYAGCTALTPGSVMYGRLHDELGFCRSLLPLAKAAPAYVPTLGGARCAHP